MGSMNRGQLISEALELAGDTSLTPRVEAVFNAALLRIYSSAAWPFLIKRLGPASGPLGPAIGSNTMGPLAPGGLFGKRIHEVREVWIAEANGPGRWQLDVYPSRGGGIENDPLLSYQPQNGRPTKVICTQQDTSPWTWMLEFDKRLDQVYRCVVVAHTLPMDLMLNIDIPIYPNDITIMQAIKLYGLEHQLDERWAVEDAKLERMIAEDRAVHVKLSDSGGPLPLSRKFKQRYPCR